MSYLDLSVIAAGHEMPIGDDRAPVQTQAESRKNGRIARREAPDKSGQDTINRPSITFFVRMMDLSDSTHDLVGSNESRAAFCHAQRVKCHGKEPVRVQFPQIEGRS